MTRKHESGKAVGAGAGGGRIEQRVELKAPIAAVWEALTDSRRFGSWFQVKIREPFKAGEVSTGNMTGPECETLRFAVTVKELRPQSLFSYTWHPYAVDPRRDYSAESPTLVEFRLEPAGQGTRLTITESGFAALPSSRREEAFRGHSEGWSVKAKDLEDFLAAEGSGEQRRAMSNPQT